MKRFENKVVIVTGAGGGIGSDAAISFAAEGAKVAVSYTHLTLPTMSCV